MSCWVIVAALAEQCQPQYGIGPIELAAVAAIQSNFSRAENLLHAERVSTPGKAFQISANAGPNRVDRYRKIVQIHAPRPGIFNAGCRLIKRNTSLVQ